MTGGGGRGGRCLCVNPDLSRGARSDRQYVRRIIVTELEHVYTVICINRESINTLLEVLHYVRLGIQSCGIIKYGYYAHIPTKTCSAYLEFCRTGLRIILLQLQ